MRRLSFAIAVLTVALGARADAPAAPDPKPASIQANPAATNRLGEFFGRTKGTTRLVPASEVLDGVRAGTSKYLIVDVRPLADYAKAHVPGAINLPIDVLFRPANVARLSDAAAGKPILLVCQSGHTESMALGGLAALGFEPWALKFGMIGWSAATKVKAGSPAAEGDTVHGVGGPVER
jgi:rhodanese-related sulfurtransferase